jgi:hypothetical protein
MPQPNKGTHGKPHTSTPIMEKGGSKADHWDKIKTGIHTKGTKGKGNK